MALINKKRVIPRETASYKLDCSTIELVRFYSEFIGSPQEHVVNEALLYIFRKDKDFNDWLRVQGKPDLLQKASADAAEDSGKLKGFVVGASPILRGNKS